MPNALLTFRGNGEVEMPLTLFTPHIVEQSIASTEQIRADAS